MPLASVTISVFDGRASAVAGGMKDEFGTCHAPLLSAGVHPARYLGLGLRKLGGMLEQIA